MLILWFDPITMKVDLEPGKNVPAWFLDSNYNGLCFHVNQAFFPRTGAWDSIKKALKGTDEKSVWEHLAGTTSAPFEVGEHRQIAVKVIDDRGNELLVVKDLRIEELSKMNNSESAKSNNNRLPLIITLLLGVIFIGLTALYLNPQILMTDTAKTLKGKDFVETENTIRGNVLSIGGAIFIVATLWVSIVQTGISEKTLNATLKQLESERERGWKQLDLERQKVDQEREKEWKNKVEEAYIEWDEAFLSGTKNGIYIVRYRVNGDSKKEEEAKREHSTDHFIREKATLRILMFEQRDRVLEIFKNINKYPYPHYPITKNIEDKKQREEAKTLFWNIANRNEKIIGYFYGITQERLTNFCDWISNPDDEFELPNFNNYLDVIKEEVPPIKNLIEKHY